MPDLSMERMCTGLVAGVDEAGRGPWAGPVVAAAVILPIDPPQGLLTGLDDSKKLSAPRREVLLTAISACADIGIGAASVAEIERENILTATNAAMRRAINGLTTLPDTALIDGNRLPPNLPCTGRTMVKGDSLSLSIAAASIVAKVTRDRIMRALASRYPAFGWEKNAGYGTRQHQDGLAATGVTPHHRRSYAPIAKILSLGGLGGADIV
ncbi:MAG: Ribonuclease HII [Alphaproteobacteria bacterium MarineAlpha11_Bin1]|nr:MAG: Ribonuclease HII [Alphaproteobacteria bacterium MarineAlpha11_Bin1]|tara:strand:- start:1856 stop:2488 length:633 start_codon:yes stop_codon:yes gene_type:complete